LAAEAGAIFPEKSIEFSRKFGITAAAYPRPAAKHWCVFRIPCPAFAQYDVKPGCDDDPCPDGCIAVNRFIKEEEPVKAGPDDLRILHRRDDRSLPVLVGRDDQSVGDPCKDRHDPQ